MELHTISRVGHSTMDDAHEEFERLAGVANLADDPLFPAHLHSLIEHLRAHFGDEDRLMRTSSFPPRDCHMREHDAVLHSASEVSQRVADGQIAVGRAFLNELTNWFPGHVDYLDSALAAWLSKQRHGAKPVVLQRTRSASAPARPMA